MHLKFSSSRRLLELTSRPLPPYGTCLLTPQEAMDELCSTFTSFRSRMRRHLEEEELVGLPFLRKYYRAEEAKTAINKIADDMKPSQVAWLLRRLVSGADARLGRTSPCTVAAFPAAARAFIMYRYRYTWLHPSSLCPLGFVLPHEKCLRPCLLSPASLSLSRTTRARWR